MAVPLAPPTNVRPASPDRLKVPLVTVSWVCTVAAPASTSLIEMRFPLPAEKTSAVSSLVVCAAGTLFTGASLTALTVMLTVSVSVSVPPAPVLPRSLVTMVRVAGPL